MSTYGAIPTLDYIDQYAGKPHHLFEVVGYGLTRSGTTFDDTSSTLVVAVTSFGFSSTCSGVGGAYRLDQPDDLAFLATFGITP